MTVPLAPTNGTGLVIERPGRILIVEDEVNLARAVAQGLNDEGFAVEVVFDGERGLARAEQGSFDLIILDILLPGINGFRLCALLRSRGVATPILMLTAKDGELDEAEALDTGADDFLTKPFSFVILLARVRALLRRGQPARSAPLTVGDLVLDPGAHRCHRGGQEIELTPREFSVLECLMASPGQALTKVEILERVWGAEFEGDPNIVEVYVGYLRRKIDQPFGRNSLRTVRGVGYRLDDLGD